MIYCRYGTGGLLDLWPASAKTDKEGKTLWTSTVRSRVAEPKHFYVMSEPGAGARPTDSTPT